MTEQTYKARAGSVYRPDGSPLPLEPSLKLRNHSPTGFAWGYLGSGPAQLALAILLDHTSDEDLSLRYYQDFKTHVIASVAFESRDWDIPKSYVETWIRGRPGIDAFEDNYVEFVEDIISLQKQICDFGHLPKPQANLSVSEYKDLLEVQLDDIRDRGGREVARVFGLPPAMLRRDGS